MFIRLRRFFDRFPHLTGFLVAVAWTLFWLSEVSHSRAVVCLVLSALPLGFFIGAFRVFNWKDLFKKFPLAFLSYFIVGWVFTAASLKMMEAPGDPETVSQYVGEIRRITLFSNPVVLAGELLGWLLVSKA
ncbi:MAG: hypothetical protein WC728_16840 [Elusimicrobiota bacterium]